jgi:TfoX/Sxy family transcriptional regulator of competence genes
MSDLETRLQMRLMPLGADTRKMFGGICYMLNGNMVAGTFKGELLARVDPANDKAHAKRKGAHPMKMGERVAAGYWMIPQAALAASEFDYWMAAALAFNKALPAKSAKTAKAAKSADRRK